jgi:hypothetical protein
VSAIERAKNPPGIEVVLLLVEASACHCSRSDALEWLGSRLSFLAHVAPSGEVLSELKRVVDELARLDPANMRFLARSREIAAIGL